MKKISTSTIIIIIVLLAGFAYLLFIKAPANIATNNTMSSSTDIVSTSTGKTPSMNVKSNTTSSKTSSSHVYINMLNNSFNPKTITIKVGTTVTWTNKDSILHTVIADNGGPTSAELGYGQSYSFKFSTKGIYGYHSASTLYPSMTGTIIVN
jgi:plastocyanin